MFQPLATAHARFFASDRDGSGAAAQPTPAYPKGIDVVRLASGLPKALGGEGLVMFRVTYAPGAVIEPHTDPGAAMYSVASGAIDLTVETGVASLQRAGSEATRDLHPGDTVTMTEGDAVFYDAGTTHRTSNGGADAATMLVAAIFVPNRPILQPAR
jgi:quercetin dioxygenase-like cupin family protein